MKLLILLTICGCISTHASSGLSKSDLVFVVDRSDTVYGEAVLKSAEVSQFLDGNFSNVVKTRFRNYTLVLFDETSVDVALSKNASSFSSRDLLNYRATTIRRGGNESCNGASLSGILRASQSASSKSFIIVLTDANPNDGQQLASIKKNIAATRSKVIFILMKGSCGDSRSEDYLAVAAASNGQIFYIERNAADVVKVLQSVQSSIGSQRVDLLAADEQVPGVSTKNFGISLSPIFSQVLITVAANSNSTVSVSAPNNSVSAPNNSVVSCSKLENQAICTISKPLTGEYKIKLDNITTAYAIRVSATSNLTFSYGFENFENKNSSDAKQIFSQPLTDANNTFVVKFDNPSAIKSLSSVRIVNPDGTEGESHPMQTSTAQVYYTFFTPPSSHFHLKINGTTVNGAEFQLITPTTLQPSTGNVTDNFIVKDMEYVSRETLIPDKSKNGSASSASSSSFFMATVAVFFFVVKTATHN